MFVNYFFDGRCCQFMIFWRNVDKNSVEMQIKKARSHLNAPTFMLNFLFCIQFHLLQPSACFLVVEHTSLTERLVCHSIAPWASCCVLVPPCCEWHRPKLWFVLYKHADFLCACDAGIDKVALKHYEVSHQCRLTTMGSSLLWLLWIVVA